MWRVVGGKGNGEGLQGGGVTGVVKGVVKGRGHRSHYRGRVVLEEW